MNIAYINTFKSGGGAAIACSRLIQAIQLHYPDTVTSFITLSDRTQFDNLKATCKLSFEKIPIWLNLRDKKDLFKFSLASQGENVLSDRRILSADIIHIHWINNAFISLKILECMLKLGKPIIWTMHDMWPFTGGCHYSKGCMNYQNGCRSCHYLFNSSMAERHLKRKSKLLASENMYFVGCSHWISGLAKMNPEIIKKNVYTIPNPINQNKRELQDVEKVREELDYRKDEFVITFSSANLNDPRKGLVYILEPLRIISKKHKLKFVLIGKGEVDKDIINGLEVVQTGFLSSETEIDKYVGASNLYICPSIEDNLPNTVMESLVLGTPVLGFDVGGLSDLVIHKENGYLTEINTTSIVTGLEWLISNNQKFNRATISANALSKFSNEVVAASYMKLYHKVVS